MQEILGCCGEVSGHIQIPTVAPTRPLSIQAIGLQCEVNVPLARTSASLCPLGSFVSVLWVCNDRPTVCQDVSKSLLTGILQQPCGHVKQVAKNWLAEVSGAVLRTLEEARSFSVMSEALCEPWSELFRGDSRRAARPYIRSLTIAHVLCANSRMEDLLKSWAFFLLQQCYTTPACIQAQILLLIIAILHDGIHAILPEFQVSGI